MEGIKRGTYEELWQPSEFFTKYKNYIEITAEAWSLVSGYCVY